MRLRHSAATTMLVFTLFFIGNTANAGWRDWLWPFGLSQTPATETPSAEAQTAPTGTADQGFQQPIQQPVTQPTQEPFHQPTTTTNSDTNAIPFVTQLIQTQPVQTQPTTQPTQPTQPYDQAKPMNDTGRFFCNSLGRKSTRDECDRADKEQGAKMNQQQDEQRKKDDERVREEQKNKDERFRMESEQSRQEAELRIKKDDEMKRDESGRQQQKEAMPFPGQGQGNDGQFPGQGATQGIFPGGPDGQRPMKDDRRGPDSGSSKTEQKQEFNFDDKDTNRPQIFVDPQFVKQVNRELNDQTRELKRLLKTAKKLAGAESAVTQVQELLAKISDFKSKMKSLQGEDLQELIDDFHNEQIWESLNGIRARVELPKQLKEMDKSFKRVERLFKLKAIKNLSAYGIDLAKVQGDLAGLKEKVTNVRTLLATGSGEEAQEAMQEVWEDGFHPGEIEGTLQQLRGMTDNIKRIRNKEIQAMVKEVFQPVVDAINEGDYREANQLLNELQFEMQKVFAQLYKLKAKSKLSNDLRSRLEAFEARIQDKLNASDSGGKDSDNGPSEGF